MSENTTDNLGLYLVNLVMGREGTPGAPILHLSLLVNATNGQVTGHGVQTQAVAAPGDKITIGNITGQIHGAGFGGVTKLVALQGQAFISFPPPAIGSYVAPFFSSFGVNNDWSGEGGWTLGNTRVEDAPVTKVDAKAAGQ